ncbi:3-oxoacyl-[acyl-carrier-protein] reductase [candidate division WOR-3 bacterium 4484_100]|uniref:3-oxoacyl-[acyl-carrier-protein] reductase n=1 Tax=candidate division WOR-3 bacterium 4484_100 TaxID=1936077 RepID=A0A1V4QEJ5_UNCW3|nr:MAG: 3-oxoacyl-[acyl-carrier-protein] reductase [candidate division WOR-3 bacterium 4484_100]
MRIEEEVALITGGASGIGAAIARMFAQAGAQVALVDIDADAGVNTAQEIGEHARFYKLDISSPQEVEDVVNRVLNDFKRIDILVNNAGITNDKLLIRMSTQDWEDVLKVNLTGTFLVTRAVARIMLKQHYGRIINIASVIGLIGNAGQANYAASKAGIIGFTKSCAKEFARRNVTVNAIAPGFIQTRMTDKLPEEIKANYLQLIPLNRFGTPQDVANLALFLASEQASYITGQVIALDGGMVM